MSGKKKITPRVLARDAILCVAALLLSYIESLLPLPLPVPGIRIGLSHLVILFALYRLTFAEALVIDIFRMAVSSLLFGSLPMLLYSVAGGLLSLLCMFLLKKTGVFSPFGVSIAGGVIHNLGQFAVAWIVLRTAGLIAYLPFLILAGCVSGALTGFIGGLLIAKIPQDLTS